MSAPGDGPQPDANGNDGGWVGLFVRRPILAVALNLLIVIAGIAALRAIEVRELPDVDRPVVSVRTSYAGATPESIDAQITAVIEGAVSRVPGVTEISSKSDYGRSRVAIEFSESTSLESAAMDVRDAVAGITSRLPDDMKEAPRVVKADEDASPIMRLAIASGSLSEGELTDMVTSVVESRLSAVSGVAAANSYGLRAKTIEVRVRQVALAARGLGLNDLIAAIGKASVTAPSGALETATQQLLVRAESPVLTPADVGVLELTPQTKVGDVAHVRWAFQQATAMTRLDGKTAIGVEIIRQAQSNTIAVSDGVRAAVEELRRSLPSDLEIAITSDDAVFIREAIREVVLTLLALVVAAGIVVDDAIVVLENIARHRAIGAGPRAAAVLGTKEVVFAVLSTTATLAAVFVPISFMPGIVGNLFSEFGFVLAFAVAVSSFVALVLCPMLASKLGTGPADAPVPARLGPFGRLGALGALGARAYAGVLDVSLKLRWLVVAACLGFAGLGWVAYLALPKEITPTEDRGTLSVRLSTQQGSNLAYMSDKTRIVEAVLSELKERGEVTSVLAMIGRGGTNEASVVAPLAHWSERRRSQQEIQAEVQRKLANVAGLEFPRGRPTASASAAAARAFGSRSPARATIDWPM